MWCLCRRHEAYFGRVVTKLQALRRGLVQARLYRRMRRSAGSIQAAWRCAAARRAFLRHRAAAVCIQARWRGLLALRAYHAARVGRLVTSFGCCRIHDTACAMGAASLESQQARVLGSCVF